MQEPRHHHHLSRTAVCLLVVLAALAATQAGAEIATDLSAAEREAVMRTMTAEEKRSLVAAADGDEIRPRESASAKAAPADASLLLYPLPTDRTPNDGIDNDGGWLLVDFCTAGATGSGAAQPPDCHHNDDDSAVYGLTFAFDFYDTAFSQVYINNNGNLSFGQLFSTFTSSGFPVNGFPMVAPFWGDVDTGDQYDPADKPGHVWYRFMPGENTFVVTWDGVGHYNENDARRNLFQVAISDGWTEGMGLGNNVCFSYGDMQWTTGDASGGSNGFGGVPATVGVNRGNGVDFAQIGRFDHEGGDYDGPGGAADGVSYLDDQTFCFNVSGENVPPIPQGFPSDGTVLAECDVPFAFTGQFSSPEINQTTTISVLDVADAQGGGLAIATTDGNPATLELAWTPDAADVGAYQLLITAEDDGTPAESTELSLVVVVDCPNQPPVADPGGPYSGDEGAAVAFDGSGSSDPDGDAITFAWSFGDGATGSGSNPSHTYVDDGTYTACLTVQDEAGLASTECTTVVIDNVAPTVTVSGATEMDEGQSATYVAAISDPGVNDTHVVTWDCDGDGFDDGIGSSVACFFADGPAAVAVTAQVVDDDGGAGVGSQVVTVINVAPAVGPITLDEVLLPVGVAITASAEFSDPGADTHVAEWSWGDGTDDLGAATSPVSASHVYTAAGLYQITLTVTDDDGGVGQSVSRTVAVYDPEAGFVTGGGWFDSPAGACQFGSCTDATTGRANFGFVAKYKKGATVPTGQTEFQLQVGDIDFHSTSYEWLVVSGPEAVLLGQGEVNGGGRYGLLIVAVDGALTAAEDAADLIRVKIWDIDQSLVIYDNGEGAATDFEATTELGGGNIAIHTKGN